MPYYLSWGPIEGDPNSENYPYSTLTYRNLIVAFIDPFIKEPYISPKPETYTHFMHFPKISTSQESEEADIVDSMAVQLRRMGGFRN